MDAVDLTTNERSHIGSMRGRLRKLAGFLQTTKFDWETEDPKAWADLLAEARAIQGNTDADARFVASLMAKRYLAGRFRLVEFDVAPRQGTATLHIDVSTTDGRRVVGEVRPAVPDTAVKEKANFRKDFDRLLKAQANFKFFFVTDEKDWHTIRDRYAGEIPGIRVVLLPAGEEHTA